MQLNFRELKFSLNEKKKQEGLIEKEEPLDIIGLVNSDKMPSSLGECQAVIKYLKLKSFQDQTEV